MEISNLVVVRHVDGRVVKGKTNDFFASRPHFHVTVHDSGEVVQVRVDQLKAVFFVNSLQGDAGRQDIRGFLDGPGETPKGRKIAIRFKDGEILCGYAQSWSPERAGFFVFPADAGSNNMRIYVIAAATTEIKGGLAAEELARPALAPAKKS